MRIPYKTVLNLGFVLSVPFLAAVSLNAQVVDQIDAKIPHSFKLLNKTLPAGQYTFRMDQGSDGGVMVISTADGKNLDQFMVRDSIAPTTPAHTELIFNRYGDKEFLRRIYEAGNKNGIAVSETSQEEQQLNEQGQKPVEHTETMN
jgi:hypothetical protein